MARQIRPSINVQPERYAYGANGQGAGRIFRERQRYDKIIFPDDLIPNFMETWNQDRFYGLVNTKGNTVVVDPDFLKPLYYTQNDTLYALNFVADAWRDFSDRLRELVDADQIYKNSPWAEPYAIKAWDSVDNGYNNYLTNIVYPALNEIYLTQGGRDKEIHNIDSFLSMFDNFLDELMMPLGPLTRSGFIESSFVSPLASGLMIEMGYDNYGDDFTKSYSYKDQNFQLVARIAAQYGFALDKNIPWRLIADLRSPAMQEYMHGIPIEEIDLDPGVTIETCDPAYFKPELLPDAYGYSQLEGMRDVRRRISFHFNDQGEMQPGYANYQGVRGASQEEIFEILFENAYTPTWDTDIDVLTPHLISFYNTYVAALPVVTIRDPYLYEEQVCPPQTRSITREQIDPEEFGASYDGRWKLRTFYLLRHIERSLHKSRALEVRELQKVMNIYNLSPANGYRRALRYMQQEFIGPYDTSPLTLDTVKDILDGQRKEIKHAFSDSGRQNRVRGNLY